MKRILMPTVLNQMLSALQLIQAGCFSASHLICADYSLRELVDAGLPNNNISVM